MRIFFVIALFVFGYSLGKAQDNDTINFENYYPTSTLGVVSIDSMNGIWQVGSQNKNTFTQSLSLPNAILTDTVNDYPSNNDSYIYFHVDKDASDSWGGGYGHAILDFSYKLETDSLNDNGYIEMFDVISSSWVN